ncbi:NAD(P)/FAD-dependent oxidoreductase [Vulcanisaeta thermophila]|uniref:NAD(P)/FAD-dependent oxidoreductase n=1 Tax=Vulcanisaeta thermophila TaxID=867917 RepID=UPI00085368B2|nr:NAD(P)/FAD-dependent oxidoreductase [Vulcanisaeta thermophila]
MTYDVAIIGAGPAGLFTAYELVTNTSNLRVALIDKGYKVRQRHCPLSKVGRCVCVPCHITHGIGGAGTFSDGLINLRPDVGGDLHELLGSWDSAMKLIEYIDKVFLSFGAPRDRVFEPKGPGFEEYQRTLARVGAQLIPIRQRHMGTDGSVLVIDRLTNYLETSGVDIITGFPVDRIDREGNVFVLRGRRGVIEAKTVVIAPGRAGAEWFRDEARRLGIELVPNPLDVGVRVEVPKYVMDPVTNLYMDPKIIMYTKSHDDKVRTFCTNPGGFVVLERYEDGTVGVNGETYTNKASPNTNFAILASIRLTDPLEDTIEYGKSIARLATKLGGGRPIIQRLGDLEDGRRSTWDRIRRSIVEPTLKNVTPGDIGMALPHRVLDDLLEFIHKVDNVIPGLASKYTLLYAPEIKYYSMRAVVNRLMETTVDGIFAAGDGAGLSRGINVAAATGVLAAWGVLNKFGYEVRNELYYVVKPQ